MKKAIIIILITIGIIVLISMLDYNKKENIDNLSKSESRIIQQLKHPLDLISKSILKSVMKELLYEEFLDAEWKNAIKVFLPFESKEGYTVVGTVTVSGDNVTITTGAVSADWAAMTKSPLNQGLFSFSSRSYFRTNFQLTSVLAQTAYIRVGTDSKQGYGFKITNGTLYGFTHDGTNESTILLQTGLDITKTYGIEARYLPNNKVVFWVDDPATLIRLRQVGILSTNLPIVNNIVNQDALMRVKITTNEAVAKSIKLSFFEYIQENRWVSKY